MSEATLGPKRSRIVPTGKAQTFVATAAMVNMRLSLEVALALVKILSLSLAFAVQHTLALARNTLLHYHPLEVPCKHCCRRLRQ